MPSSKRIRTSVLDLAYEESGAADGAPVFLMHGWPYDPRCYDEVVPPLVAAGCRVIVPYLRGFGPTRFLSAGTPRSGQQAALGNDLRELMDALAIERAVLAGYDWGGRAACIVAALWPERVRGLVTVNGYNIQNIAGAGAAAAPAQEHRLWYQWYFQTERGRAGLRRQPARIVPLAVEIMVAALGFRRRHLRTQRDLFRQSGFRRGDDPVLSPSLRLCRRAIRRSTRSSAGLPQSRKSRCRRSHCRARLTASGRRKPRSTTRPISRGPISAVFCRGSDTTRRRKRRELLPMPCWNWSS